MAKRKLNNLGHVFVAEWLGKDWYRDDQGYITDISGVYAGDKINTVINEQYPVKLGAPQKNQPEPNEEKQGGQFSSIFKQLGKDILETAFPGIYSVATKYRKVYKNSKKEKDTDQSDQETKRSIGDVKYSINYTNALLKDNNALIREQLVLQSESIDFLERILDKVGGGKGNSLLNAAEDAAVAATAGAALLAGGGVVLSYLDTKMVQGPYGEQLAKAQNSSEASGVNMLGALNPDEALGSYIMHPELNPALQQEKLQERYDAREADDMALGTALAASAAKKNAAAVQDPMRKMLENRNKAVNQSSFMDNGSGLPIIKASFTNDSGVITPNETEQIKAAKNQTTDDEKNNLDIEAISINFLSERLNFNVDTLTLDADEVKKSLTTKFGSIRGGSITPGLERFGGKYNDNTSSGGGAAGADIGNYNYSGPGLAATGSEKEAIDFFVSKGWSPEQAAGLAANIKVESGFRTNAVGDGGEAYGIAQWHPDRQAEFQAKFGKPIRESTFQEQLAFMHYELTEGKEKAAGNILKNSKSAAEAAANVDHYYERSSGATTKMRMDIASGLAKGMSQQTEQAQTNTPSTAPMPQSTPSRQAPPAGSTTSVSAPTETSTTNVSYSPTPQQTPSRDISSSYGRDLLQDAAFDPEAPGLSTPMKKIMEQYYPAIGKNAKYSSEMAWT
jgi:hypothetical protein